MINYYRLKNRIKKYGETGDSSSDVIVSIVQTAVDEELPHFHATMDTEHYTWSSYGVTEEDAKNRILEKWNSEPTIRKPVTLEFLEEGYGINVEPIELGCTYD